MPAINRSQHIINSDADDLDWRRSAVLVIRQTRQGKAPR
jgi:hypothetical protein